MSNMGGGSFKSRNVEAGQPLHREADRHQSGFFNPPCEPGAKAEDQNRKVMTQPNPVANMSAASTWPCPKES